MKTNQPPTVAKWLLRHLGSSTNNETILGDLDERYRQGRSVAWYWKQVLTAVIVASATAEMMSKRLSPVGLPFGRYLTPYFPSLDVARFWFPLWDS